MTQTKFTARLKVAWWLYPLTAALVAAYAVSYAFSQAAEAFERVMDPDTWCDRIERWGGYTVSIEPDEG